MRRVGSQLLGRELGFGHLECEDRHWSNQERASLTLSFDRAYDSIFRGLDIQGHGDWGLKLESAITRAGYEAASPKRKGQLRTDCVVKTSI